MSETKKTGEMVYVPFGEKSEITLTPSTVSRYIAVKTRSGKTASMDEVIKFMMLCKARELNPYAGDAFLVGYDSKDGPKYSLITAHQALLKRSEANCNFDGMESGIIVNEGEDKGIREVPGTFVAPGQQVVGGWCKVYRKDRSHPFYHSVDLKVCNTGMSRWAKDPAGMIAKVAEGGALRKAFPTQLGGLYTSEEMDAEVDGRFSDRAPKTVVAAPTSLDDFVIDEPIEVGFTVVSDIADEKTPGYSIEYRSILAQVRACETVGELQAMAQLCKIANVSELEAAELDAAVLDQDINLTAEVSDEH